MENSVEEIQESFLPDFLVEQIAMDLSSRVKVPKVKEKVKAFSYNGKGFCPDCDEWVNLEDTFGRCSCPKCASMLEDVKMKGYTYKENPEYVVNRKRPRVPDNARKVEPNCEESIVQFDRELCVKLENTFIRFDETGAEVREMVVVPCAFNRDSRCALTAKGRTLRCTRS